MSAGPDNISASGPIEKISYILNIYPEVFQAVQISFREKESHTSSPFVSLHAVCQVPLSKSPDFLDAWKNLSYVLSLQSVA